MVVVSLVNPFSLCFIPAGVLPVCVRAHKSLDLLLLHFVGCIDAGMTESVYGAQEVVDLRRGLAAAECTAESRRKALLAEKAKAQNALGQLAISREKVRSRGHIAGMTSDATSWTTRPAACISAFPCG